MIGVKLRYVETLLKCQETSNWNSRVQIQEVAFLHLLPVGYQKCDGPEGLNPGCTVACRLTYLGQNRGLRGLGDGSNRDRKLKVGLKPSSYTRSKLCVAKGSWGYLPCLGPCLEGVSQRTSKELLFQNCHLEASKM